MNKQKLLLIFEIIGLSFTLSYLIIILFIWIVSNLYGYEIVKFSEENLIIKYIEWFGGFAGIFVVTGTLKIKIIKIIRSFKEES